MADHSDDEFDAEGETVDVDGDQGDEEEEEEQGIKLSPSHTRAALEYFKDETNVALLVDGLCRSMLRTHVPIGVQTKTRRAFIPRVLQHFFLFQTHTDQQTNKNSKLCKIANIDTLSQLRPGQQIYFKAFRDDDCGPATDDKGLLNLLRFIVTPIIRDMISALNYQARTQKYTQQLAPVAKSFNYKLRLDPSQHEEYLTTGTAKCAAEFGYGNSRSNNYAIEEDGDDDEAEVEEEPLVAKRPVAAPLPRISSTEPQQIRVNKDSKGDEKKLRKNTTMKKNKKRKKFVPSQTSEAGKDTHTRTTLSTASIEPQNGGGDGAHDSQAKVGSAPAIRSPAGPTVPTVTSSDSHLSEETHHQPVSSRATNSSSVAQQRIIQREPKKASARKQLHPRKIDDGGSNSKKRERTVGYSSSEDEYNKRRKLGDDPEDSPLGFPDDLFASSAGNATSSKNNPPLRQGNGILIELNTPSPAVKKPVIVPPMSKLDEWFRSRARLAPSPAVVERLIPRGLPKSPTSAGNRPDSDEEDDE